MLFLSSPSFAEHTKLTVLLDWFPNPNHAPLFVAKQQGFFKEQGLEVELIGPADPADPPKLVAARKADIAITYEPEFIQQVKQGLPLMRIGTLIDQPLSCVLVKKSSQIKTLADLKGKKIGYSGSNTSTILEIMLKKHHVSLHDVELINVHYDLTQALLSGKIDAAAGMMRNFEIIQMELVGIPARAFLPEKEGVSTYSELIFVANAQNPNDPRFQKFIAALKKAVIYLKKNPDACWTAFVKNHPELDDELNRRAWVITVPYFTDKVEKINGST